MHANAAQVRELLLILVERDLRSRTKQALIGYGWIVLQPLVATGVFTLLVQFVFRLDLSGDLPYPLFLLSGLVIWQYFANSLIASTESLTQHLDLVTQVAFPRVVLVLYPIVARLLDVSVGLALLGVFMAIYRVPPSWTLLLLPALVLLAGGLAFALGLILAPIQAALRDTARLVTILLGLALYAAPVVYPLASVPERWQALYLVNPMAAIVAAVHQVVLAGQPPEPGPIALAIAIVLVTVLVADRAFRVFETVLADII